METIIWKDNMTFPTGTTTRRAIVLATTGLDNGLEGCFMIRPMDDGLASWLDFLCYLEYCYEKYNHAIVHMMD